MIDGRRATSPMVLNCAKLTIGTNADVSITSIDFFMVQSYCSCVTWKNTFKQYV